MGKGHGGGRSHGGHGGHGGHSFGGHHGHGFGGHHRSSFGHHHHSRGGGGGPGQIEIFQMMADVQASTQIFVINEGILTLSGSQILVNGRMDSITHQQTQTITQINLTIVGQKVKAKNNCCFFSTLIIGALLILPLILMCFQWWKDMVHPKYAINMRTYEAVVQLIRKCTTTTFLNLIVIDGNLTKQKLELLALGISQSSITRFSLVNSSMDSNYESKEYDNFQQNSQCFQRLNIKNFILQWRSTTVYPSGQQSAEINGFNEMQFMGNPQMTQQ